MNNRNTDRGRPFLPKPGVLEVSVSSFSSGLFLEHQRAELGNHESILDRAPEDAGLHLELPPRIDVRVLHLRDMAREVLDIARVLGRVPEELGEPPEGLRLVARAAALEIEHLLHEDRIGIHELMDDLGDDVENPKTI